jgi:hypothetical protein
MPTNPADLTKALYLSKDVEDANLIAALSSVLEISSEDILVTRVEKWWLIERGEKQVVCQAELHGGDFPLWINLYKYGGSAKLPHDDADTVKLCQLLDVFCLVDDMNDKNPYSWLLIKPNGTITKVYSDSEKAAHEGLVLII